MRSSREIDARIAKEVFGYEVRLKNEILFENAPDGERLLRPYSKEMGCAQEVMERMKMTVIPIVGDEWFVFVGPVQIQGWESPQAVLQFLEAGKFDGCGAASGKNLPAIICDAALKAMEKRTFGKPAEAAEEQPIADNVTHLIPPSHQRH